MEFRPSVVSLLGSVIEEGYRLVQVLGEGGMGAVYKAEQPDGPPVAVKVLHEELGDQPELRERFEREARALFGLQHPHVLEVSDFGIFGGNPYLVMELLEGQDLSALIEEREVLELDEALNLGLQVLEGLAFAHAQGALHRDLKTENVFVARRPDGSMHAKLLDFGLVKFVDDERWGNSKKLTVTGSVFGTPAYMAPEQCAGAPVGPAGDVYAAGVILFELFTGIWPFMEESRLAMFQAHLTKAPPTMTEARHEEVPLAIEAVVAKALAKSADDRFPSAVEMLAALKAAAPSLSATGAFPKPPLWLWVAVAAALLGVGAAIAVALT